MDRRTVIFVLLVGITFFGFNLFFSRQQDDKNREILKQQEAKSKKEDAQRAEEIKSRTAQPSDLPLTTLYLDQEKTLPLSKGIDLNEGILTLAWDDSLPDSIFANGSQKWLVTKNPVKNGPVLYASSDFKTLDIASLPDTGTYDLQLVSFPSPNTVRIYLGEYSQGDLSILQGPLLENAIALYKGPSAWLPFGFYEGQGSVFVNLQKLPILSGLISPLTQSQGLIGPQQKDQKFYKLENAYQQLVFSNIGGALVEINLPFQSGQDKSSVVKEIGFDREIAEDSPKNARFPAHPYYSPDSDKVHPSGEIGGYYPLLRRGIWNQKDTPLSPSYYALNIVSDYPEMAELLYDVKEFTQNKIVFEARQPHRKITKTYTLSSGSEGAPYILDLELQVEGDSRGLWLVSGVPEVEIMSNSSSPMIQYRMSRKGKSEVEKLSLPKINEIVTVSSIYPDWVVNSNGYLGLILDPLETMRSGYKVAAIAGAKVPTRLSVINPKHQPYPASKYPGYQVMLPLSTKGGITKFRVYAGPFEESVLKKVDAIYSDPNTGYNPDYLACRTFYGWFSFISEPFAKFLFIVMKFFHSVTGSWGFSIILLTVFLRVLLYPLNAWSIKSMRRMQQISPQIQAIQARHKKEPKKAQAEIMALYREKKVNPFTGCIPILIQLPFLIAMFDLLKSSFQLRGASFIPGWIDNLTAPDVLFSWQTPIFFIGNQFHLLPILLGVVMFFQQRLFSTAPKDPNKMTDQQRQQKAMGSIMTVVFTVMFYHFPSGLNLYWLSSMLLGILQQMITNKILDKKKERDEVLVTKSGKKLATKRAK